MKLFLAAAAALLVAGPALAQSMDTTPEMSGKMGSMSTMSAKDNAEMSAKMDSMRGMSAKKMSGMSGMKMSGMSGKMDSMSANKMSGMSGKMSSMQKMSANDQEAMAAKSDQATGTATAPEAR
jgi:hypothetical protein